MRTAVRTSRRSIVGTLIAALLVCCPQTAAAEGSFTITGHGWGHGVGMGQYGAQGYALNGWTHDRILAHYYSGTTIEQAAPQDVRVLLQDDRRQVVASADSGLIVSDEGGSAQRQLPAPARVTLSQTTSGLALLDAGGKTLETGWTGPVSIAAVSGPVTLVGSTIGGTVNRSYRGRLRVFVNQAGALATVNVVGLEGYLKGVVSSEMPSNWEPEALQSQAVAARSYALATRKVGATFDLYPDDRSQVYGGVQAERDTSSAAVDATAGQTISKDGKVVVAYFSSTTGGRTANIEESFANAKPSPVFVAVDDPYDTISPYHDWTVTKTATQVADGLGYSGTVTDIAVKAFPTGRVQTVEVNGSAGQASFPASSFRTALGLRSTWFAIGGPPPPSPPADLHVAGPVTLHATIVGARVDLKGSAQPGIATLQAFDSGSWSDLATHAVGDDGAIAFRRPFGESARYRIAQGTVRSNEVAVQRGTGMLLRGRIGGRLRGSVFPASARGTVTLQHVIRGRWRTLARTAVESGGRFRYAVLGSKGRWRVLFAGASLYRPSRSAELHLPVVTRRLQWVPTDPQTGEQWGLARIHAFDYAPALPSDPARVRVAVIDGGIDEQSPDLIGPDGKPIVIAHRRYQPGTRESVVHGTAVAGILAAQPNNGIGGVGACVPYCQIVDLRVVGKNGEVDLKSEAQAIREAVSIYKVNVINLSLGGTRDPNGKGDEFSGIERDAINEAVRRGVVVIAAVGNGGGRYASYPAALPHVIGVSAVDQNDVVPAFSNRDLRFNDLAAPGVGVLTTLPSFSKEPTALVTGTSFAAPFVSAAAAVVLARNPLLTVQQVTRVLEQTSQPLVGVGNVRTEDSGFGVVDLARALDRSDDPALALPETAQGEPGNDIASAGQQLISSSGQFDAAIDDGDDRTDVYRIQVAAGDTLSVTITPESPLLQMDHSLWVPGAKNVTSRKRSARMVSGWTSSSEPTEIVATKTGLYRIVVQAVSGGGPYRLAWTTTFG